MEIKDRLKKIIESENLTSSAFADIIGVQRSSISHILSGRNKPGLDFIQKILTAFPKYRAEWLIMGAENIYKEPLQATLFDTITQNSDIEQVEVDDKASQNEKKQIEEKNPITGNNNINESIETKDNKIEFEDNQAKNDNNRQKKAIKIVIFYSDKTFSEYYPE
jgi:transcriptional regulator with XRE-family HTH domain